MGGRATLRVMPVIVLSLCLALWGAMASPARAQDSSSSLDTEARALFTAGQTAFNDARYADALGHFKRAFELSQRSVLLYNIGITEDRLRHDEEALAAFERFLAEVPDHPKRREVEARVDVLRQTIAEQQARAQAQPQAQVPTPTQAAQSQQEPLSNGAPSAAIARDDSGASIVGPVILGGVGLVGVALAVRGLVASNDCLSKMDGVCVEERKTAWAPTVIYGGLGLAAVAGAVVWLVAGGSEEAPAPASAGLRLVGNNVEVRF